jgi:hypothetical protein
MKLYKVRLIKCLEAVRSSRDARNIVDRYIYEYSNGNCELFRKSFEVKPTEIPNIPEEGTHEKINNLKYQY